MEDEPKTPPIDVSWTAPEFLAHNKSFAWFAGLAAACAAFAAVIYLLTKDVVSTAVIIVAGVIFGVMANKKPRHLEYSINAVGISIGGRSYSYDEFKAFSIRPEPSKFLSITFTPLKRFAPYLTIYYSPDQEEKIMAVLAARLPYEEPRRDAVDGLMRRIRF